VTERDPKQRERALVETRPMTEGDRSYVFSTWLNSYWPTASGIRYRHRSKVDYQRTHDARIKLALLEGMRVTVGFDSEFPGVIVGWVAHTNGTLHFLYVRKELRRNGVARELLATASGLWAHSHATADLARLRAAGALHTVYRPGHFPDIEQPRAAEQHP
jgi:GNAT superfamily N-acetyltransferase